VFEWYDFYLYGSLAAIIAKQFLLRPQRDQRLHRGPARLPARLCRAPSAPLLSRPLGDLVGRSTPSSSPSSSMGLSTFWWACCPVRSIGAGGAIT